MYMGRHIFYTGNLSRDIDCFLESEDAAEAEALENAPRCAHCDMPILEEFAVCIEGNFYCDDCLSGALRKRTDCVCV